MQNFSTTPKAMLVSLVKNKELIKALIKREVIGRYRGSVLGILWSFFNPVLMLTVYTFVFSVVFNARWSNGSDSKTEFALVLFAGLIVFNLFSECVTRSPTLILNNINYVKKVIFPLEIFPWVSLGSAIFHALVNIIVWLCAYCILFGFPHSTILLLPLVLLPLIFFIMGITWVLAALSVYLRDISQFLGMCMTVLMFLSPIFYSPDALPEQYRAFLLLNPLTPIIVQVRDVMFWGILPDMYAWFAYCASSAACACLGFLCFQKARKGFADVL